MIGHHSGEIAVTPNPTHRSYNANRAVVSDQELLAEMRQHGGQLVARSLDGIETYCYADSYDEIYRLLAEQGFAPDEAVVGGVSLFGEERIGGLYDIGLI
jgi:hypothetical protein